MSIDPCSIVDRPLGLGEPVALDFDHSLERRHPFHYKNKPTFWYDWRTCSICLPDGRDSLLPEDMPLTALLDKVASYTERKHNKKVAVLYLVAGRAVTNRPKREWFDGGDWQRTKLLWSRLQADYEQDGFTVSLHGTGNYFGEETDLHAMRDALGKLEQGLERVFDANGYKLLGDTPAQTGRELLAISLPPSWRYPRLPDDLLKTINHNFGQGRIETFPPKRDVLENGVYVLDGRFMYASCVSHLPVGPCYHDDRNEFLGVYRKDGRLSRDAFPGFYNVTVTVPENWHHIGLIKSSQAGTLTDESRCYPNVGDVPELP